MPTEAAKSQRERNLARAVGRRFPPGEHTGIQLILSGESQRERLRAYFGYLNEARRGAIAELETGSRTGRYAKSRAGREAKANQQTLLYEQRAPSRRSWSRRVMGANSETLAGLESSIQQASNELKRTSRANERIPRLRNSIARAEAAAAKARRAMARGAGGCR